MEDKIQRQSLEQRTPQAPGATTVDSNQTVPDSDTSTKEHAFLKPGYMVAGRYKIVSQIGQGGMGVVYKVEQAALKAVHALKVLDAGRASQTSFARFQKEAQASFHLNHRNLIRVYDFGVLEDDHPYLVMDYAEGISLTELIKSRGKLTKEDALDIFLQVCDGIGYAHDHGVVHRDLKPSNIMLTLDADGSTVVKIVDFGIAKFVQGEEQQGLTRTGEVFGSPLYMSPEQCGGLQIDQRSDIYACGCALFETLTGNPPFLSSTALATMLKHQTEAPSTLKEATLGEKFPESLEYVVAKLLEKQPAQRYQSMMALKQDLQAVKDGRPLSSASPLPNAKPRPSKKFLTAAIIGCAVVVSASAWLAVSNYSGKRRMEGPPPAAAGVLPNPAPPTDTTSTKLHLADLAGEPFAKVPLKQAEGGPWDLYFPDKMLGVVELSTGNDTGNAANSERTKAKGHVHFTRAVPLVFSPSWEACDFPQMFRSFRSDEISKMNFGTNPNANDDLLFFIKHLTGLHSLLLDHGEVSDQGLEHIQNLPSLTELRIENTKVTGAGLAHMKNLQNFQKLKVSAIENASALIHALRKSSAIKQLQLRRDHLSDNDLENLSHIQSLRLLFIAHNPGVTDKGIGYLKNLKNLRDLDVADCKITPACVPSLAQIPKLTTLRIDASKWSPEEQGELKRALPNCSFSHGGDF